MMKVLIVAFSIIVLFIVIINIKFTENVKIKKDSEAIMVAYGLGEKPGNAMCNGMLCECYIGFYRGNEVVILQDFLNALPELDIDEIWDTMPEVEQDILYIWQGKKTWSIDGGGTVHYVEPLGNKIVDSHYEVLNSDKMYALARIIENNANGLSRQCAKGIIKYPLIGKMKSMR